MPKLLLKFNAAVIKEYGLDKPILTVGRKPDNDIVIDNPAVSGHHCRIILQGDTYYVEDAASTNGTYINDKRIIKAGLRNNDVVGLATKHALVYIEDPPGQAPPAENAASKAATAPAPSQPPTQGETPKDLSQAGTGQPEVRGGLRILKGVVDKPEYELKALSTYIGKSDRVQIPIQGSGLFGSAPEVAASVHRRPEGYVLVAVKDGYPLLNGTKVSGQTVLKDGDIIDCGATTMQFYLKNI